MQAIKLARCGPDGFHMPLFDLEGGLNYVLTTLIKCENEYFQLVEIKAERTDRNSGKQKLLVVI